MYLHSSCVALALDGLSLRKNKKNTHTHAHTRPCGMERDRPWRIIEHGAVAQKAGTGALFWGALVASPCAKIGGVARRETSVSHKTSDHGPWLRQPRSLLFCS